MLISLSAQDRHELDKYILSRNVLVAVINQYNEIVVRLERRGPLFIPDPQNKKQEILNSTWSEAMNKIDGTYPIWVLTLILTLKLTNTSLAGEMDPLVIFPYEVRGAMRMQMALHAYENHLDHAVLPGPDVLWEGCTDEWFEENGFGPVAIDEVTIAAHERAIDALSVEDRIPEGAAQLFHRSGNIAIFTPKDLEAGYGES